MEVSSRITYLDSAAAKFGSAHEIKSFEEFVTIYDTEAVINLVRIAMQNYANDWHKMLKEKEESNPDLTGSI